MLRKMMILCSAPLILSCGTVVRGTKQGVKFESEPPGATVMVVRAKKEKTRWDCLSPCELQLSRKRDFSVTFELEGYKPVTGRLASRLGAKGGATAIPGNFLLGGGIGFIVDAGTGANMQLKPDPMRATLMPINSGEKSVIYDVRIEGGGKGDVQSDSVGTDSAAAVVPTSSLRKLPGLPLEFGVIGDQIDVDGSVASLMTDPYGVQITEIDPNGAAAKADFMKGDVIQSINSNRITSIDDINTYLEGIKSGETADVIIWRDSERYEATVTF